MSDGIYEVIFSVAEVLELPVILLALAALAYVVVELGSFVVEWVTRQRRDFAALVQATQAAVGLVAAGHGSQAAAALAPQARSSAMAAALTAMATDAAGAAEASGAGGGAGAGAAGGVGPATQARIAKRLADFDFGCQARLARTRLLVRFGPALGLMGTLIPLSPALEGLAAGDTATLTENLRIAFSVTVLGLLVGVLAFAISLVRERLYGQDYSDLEYVAAVLTAPPADTAPPAGSSPEAIAPEGTR